MTKTDTIQAQIAQGSPMPATNARIGLVIRTAAVGKLSGHLRSEELWALDEALLTVLGLR